MGFLNTLEERQRLGKKSLAVLIDPDKVKKAQDLRPLINLASENCIDFFFVGGSLVTSSNIAEVIREIKNHVSLPVVLFPGNSIQVNDQADALLFLSLISGRNPEFLIGQHVIAAPHIKKSSLEVVPTGYILIHSGKITSVSYMSHTIPIPEDKYSIASCTAMAGEMLGMKLMYLEAGSGALQPVSAPMIRAVRQSINTPLIVGGGINSGEKAMEAFHAGADLVVIGNALEKDPGLLTDMAEKTYDWNQRLS